MGNLEDLVKSSEKVLSDIALGLQLDLRDEGYDG